MLQHGKRHDIMIFDGLQTNNIVTIAQTCSSATLFKIHIWDANSFALAIDESVAMGINAPIRY